MSKLFLVSLCVLISIVCNSQSITDIKYRFNTYLNFKGSLNSSVSFSDNSVSIMNAGKPEFTVYVDEQKTFANLLLQLNPKDFTSIYTWKKNKHLTKVQLDSLQKVVGVKAQNA